MPPSVGHWAGRGAAWAAAPVTGTAVHRLEAARPRPVKAGGEWGTRSPGVMAAHLALAPVTVLAGVGLWLQTLRRRRLRGRVQALEEALFQAKVLLRERAGDLAQNARDVEEWLAELLPVIRALEREAAGRAPGHPLLRQLEGLRALYDSMGLSLGRPPRFSALRRQVANRQIWADAVGGRAGDPLSPFPVVNLTLSSPTKLRRLARAGKENAAQGVHGEA